jgi:hypothetical protein
MLMWLDTLAYTLTFALQVPMATTHTTTGRPKRVPWTAEARLLMHDQVIAWEHGGRISRDIPYTAVLERIRDVQLLPEDPEHARSVRAALLSTASAIAETPSRRLRTTSSITVGGAH